MRLSDKMEDIKSFGFMRYWDYAKTNFFIMLKVLIEYKLHLCLGLLQEFVWHITMIPIFFLSINNNFVDLIGWSFVDFVLFILLVGVVSDLSGIIIWRSDMVLHIKSGKMNVFLLRPIRPVWGYIFGNYAYSAFIAVCVDLFLIFFVSMLFKIKYYNLLFAFIVFNLIILNHLVVTLFLKSFAFYSFGLSDFILGVRCSVKDVAVAYPSPFFNEFSVRMLFYFSAYFFVGGLLVPILRNLTIWNFWLQFGILIGLMVVFSIGLAINWHYDLKRYEAFG